MRLINFIRILLKLITYTKNKNINTEKHCFFFNENIHKAYFIYKTWNSKYAKKWREIFYYRFLRVFRRNVCRDLSYVFVFLSS
jgi:hypothetical protein